MDPRAAHERGAAHYLPADQIGQTDARRDIAAGGCLRHLFERGQRFLQDEWMAQQGTGCCACQAKLGQGKIIGPQCFRMQNGTDDRVRIAHWVAQCQVGYGGCKPHRGGEAYGAKRAWHKKHLQDSNIYELICFFGQGSRALRLILRFSPSVWDAARRFSAGPGRICRDR